MNRSIAICNSDFHVNMKDEMGIMPAAKGTRMSMFQYSNSAIITSKPSIQLGYVAGHLRFKFIREEAADENSDDEGAISNEDCDQDEDDGKDDDRCGSNEGKRNGSKANNSREVTTPQIKRSQQHCILDVIPEEISSINQLYMT